MKIKICGITTSQEALWLRESGVDYAGFVQFYEKSKRNLSVDKANEIMSALEDTVKAVAVTVQPTMLQVEQIADAGFDIIQIHGEVSDEVIQMSRIPVWKAFNVKDLSAFEKYEKMENVVGYVFDAQTPGSGKMFDWSVLDCIPKTKKTVMLAGGLNPENVSQAIRKFGNRMDGVDTSSGVENDNGIGKSREKILRFVKAVNTN